MTEGPGLDAHELLRLLAEQQTCLVQQMASLSQLQRLVVEHLVGSASSRNVPNVPSAADTERQAAETVSGYAPSALTPSNPVSAPAAPTA